MNIYQRYGINIYLKLTAFINIYLENYVNNHKKFI